MVLGWTHFVLSRPSTVYDRLQALPQEHGILTIAFPPD